MNVTQRISLAMVLDDSEEEARRCAMCSKVLPAHACEDCDGDVCQACCFHSYSDYAEGK